MRLICPNCDAQYEVDDNAIPISGRDVQCSNCGHAWFQSHALVDAGLAAVAHDPATSAAPVAMPPVETAVVTSRATVAPDAPEPPVAVAIVDAPTVDAPTVIVAKAPAHADVSPQPRHAPVKTPDEQEAAAGLPGTEPTVVAPVRRTLDDNLLAVLREEAAREAAERRAETARGIEVQTDLGLTSPTATPSAAQVSEPLSENPDPVASGRPNSRRELLPDIEEINSTLRSGSEARNDEGAIALPPPPPKGSFGSGFVSMMLIALVLVALYVLAPRVSGLFPSVEPAMNAYVAAVDAARVWLDGMMQWAAGALRNLTGDS